MDNGTPKDPETLLLRSGEMERAIASLKAENARKDRIIAASSSCPSVRAARISAPTSSSSIWTNSFWESRPRSHRPILPYIQCIYHIEKQTAAERKAKAQAEAEQVS